MLKTNAAMVRRRTILISNCLPRYTLEVNPYLNIDKSQNKFIPSRIHYTPASTPSPVFPSPTKLMPSSSASANTATSSTQIRSQTDQTSSFSSSSWTPKTIRILFSHFPLQTLPANQLPSRTLTLTSRKKHHLFLFTTACADSQNAAQIPSFNPTCLKWQTYLLMRSISFKIQPSNNHASPSGSLPFLIPGESSNSKENSKSTRVGNTVSANSLQSWISQNSDNTQEQEDETLSLRESTFLSLLEHRIRPAWLHAFYLTANLYSLAAPLYIHSVTTSELLRKWQTTQLRTAAQVEVEKVAPKMDPDILYYGAESAFEALETALGDEDWFLGREQPGMLDAAVFGYTCLLSDPRLGEEANGKWSDDSGSQRMRIILQRFERLRDHQERTLNRYFPTNQSKL